MVLSVQNPAAAMRSEAVAQSAGLEELLRIFGISTRLHQPTGSQFATIPGAPPPQDLLEILKTERVPILVPEVGTPAFALLIEESLDEDVPGEYLRRIRSGPLSVAEVVQWQNRAVGGCVVAGFANLAKALKGRPHQLSQLLWIQRLLGISPDLSRSRVVVINSHRPATTRYHALLEETLHILENTPFPISRWLLSRAVREAINDLIQLLLLSPGAWERFPEWRSYTDWTPLEQQALRRHYLGTPPVDPNMALPVLLEQVAQDVSEDRQLLIAGQHVRVLDLLLRRQARLLSGSDDPASNPLSYTINKLTAGDYLADLLAHHLFGRYQPLFPSWKSETIFGGLEERMPEWLQRVVSPIEFPTLVRHLRERTTGPTVILFDSELLPEESPGDLAVRLIELSGVVPAALGVGEAGMWQFDTMERQDRYSDTNCRILRVVRHPESAPNRLPWSAIPLISAQAAAAGQSVFPINVGSYSSLEVVSLADALTHLTDLFA